MSGDGGSPAQQARRALARARIGTLTLQGEGGAHGAGRALAVVSVEAQADGTPLVWLEPGSPLVHGLAACPVGALSTRGPSPGTRLELLGTFAPVAGHTDASGRQAYRGTLLGVRLLGEERASVPLAEFRDAAPLPPVTDQAALLDHLGHAHGEAMLARIHAEGLPGECVVPRAVRGRSVEVAVLWSDGVTTLRMVVGGGCSGSCRHDC